MSRHRAGSLEVDYLMSVLTRLSAFGGTLALGSAVALVPMAPAAAADVQCGDTITVSTKLTHDLTCSGPGDALVIGADGVVLDLGGHTITGPGTREPGAGVRAARKTGVVVTRGTITGFADGVVYDESTNGAVTKLTVRNSGLSINLAGGGGHLVEKNTVIDGYQDAIRVGNSAGNRIVKNTLVNNIWGVTVAFNAADNYVAKNVATDSHVNGIAVFAGAVRTTLEKNEVTASRGNGIQVNDDASDTMLVKNYSAGNGDDGIHVEGSAATLTKNTAVDNADLGISAPDAIDGGGNLASGNGNPAQCTGVSCSPAP